jgi:disulfide bond formation protein DsbB
MAALKFAPKPGLEKLALFGIGAAFLLCFGVAVYHVAVEHHWVLAQCEIGSDMSAIRPLGDETHFDAPRCDVIAWSLFGISMAGYNAILSGLAALVSFMLASKEKA